MIEAVVSLLAGQADWRDAVQPRDWRLLASTATRQVFMRDLGRLEMRVETRGGSAFYILNINCSQRTAQAVVVETYDRNNLAGAAAISPPGIFSLPHGPGSDVELVAQAVCHSPALRNDDDAS